MDVVTLEEIDFSGNESLTMVPKLWQGDTNSVLFVCKVHRGKYVGVIWECAVILYNFFLFNVGLCVNYTFYAVLSMTQIIISKCLKLVPLILIW